LNEFEVEVKTPDGDMWSFVTYPEGAGPFPAVIVYMDVIGIRDELQNFARRLAEEGYFAVLPDLYYREGQIRFDSSEGIEKMFAIGGALSVDMVMRDTGGILDYLGNNPLVSSSTGSVGYCMSGQFVMAAAGTFPDRIRAAASLHGTRLVTEAPNSPHKLAACIKGEVYLGFADEDPYIEDNVIPDISKALDDAGVPYTVETHPGTHHAYSFPQMPSYAEEAAEKDWAAMFAMFERQLKQS